MEYGVVGMNHHQRHKAAEEEMMEIGTTPLQYQKHELYKFQQKEP
jgi:hypothetical protein